jgi:type I restriction enzyme S subunit
MKEVWNVKPLGEVCRLVSGPFGGSLKKSIFVPDGYAVYEQRHAINNRFDEVRYFVDENKFNEMRRFELLPNDLIMSCSGTMGRVSIVPKDIKRGIINQALLKLTPPPKLLVNFLKLWMESDSFQDALKEYSAGAAIQNVASVDTLKKIKIPLPPPSEQHRIVGILDEAFEGIATAKANAEKNLQNARALFESHLQSVFTQCGEGWVDTTIGECIRFIDYRGKTPKKTESGLRLITAKNVKLGYLQHEPREFV